MASVTLVQVKELISFLDQRALNSEEQKPAPQRCCYGGQAVTECPAGDCTVIQLMPVNPGGVQPGESTVLGRAAVIEQHLWLRLPDPGGLGFGCSGGGRQQH